jgi:predicted nuclease of predicted toxin-antitoxin system
MKLLFDHHLSRKLVSRLTDIFPNSSHVALHGLERADDIDIWLFARQNDFAIVTKDSDFNDVTTLRGAPPKIIWIRVGNCTTADIERIIRQNHPMMMQFSTDPSSAILEII